jgi:heat-inducible transcriptional repressor
MRVNELTDAETHEIRGHLNARASQVEQIIRHAAQAISDITQYAAVIAQPDINEMPVRRIQLVPVTDSTALMVVVMGEGLVKEAVIHVPEGIAPDHLYFISGMLTERLNGAYPSEIKARFSHIVSDLSLNRELMAEVLSTLTDQAKEGADVPIVVGGSTNLLKYPEYSDVEKAKGFLKVLESREKLYPLLRQAGGLEFTIRIGPEIDIPEFYESSVVTATYRMGESTRGTLGIIGPTRMNYSRVVSVMSYMGKLISDMLNGISEI